MKASHLAGCAFAVPKLFDCLDGLLSQSVLHDLEALQLREQSRFRDLGVGGGCNAPGVVARTFEQLLKLVDRFVNVPKRIDDPRYRRLRQDLGEVLA